MRGKPRRTTIGDDTATRAEDLVEHDFAVGAPNRLRIADLTCVRTWSGPSVAFVTDACSRRIVGWPASPRSDHVATPMTARILEW